MFITAITKTNNAKHLIRKCFPCSPSPQKYKLSLCENFRTKLKDTLKAFNDLKNEQQKCNSMKCFLIYKSMYILKVYSLH